MDEERDRKRVPGGLRRIRIARRTRVEEGEMQDSRTCIARAQYIRVITICRGSRDQYQPEVGSANADNPYCRYHPLDCFSRTNTSCFKISNGLGAIVVIYHVDNVYFPLEYLAFRYGSPKPLLDYSRAKNTGRGRGRRRVVCGKTFNERANIFFIALQSVGESMTRACAFDVR